jgi:hypothetical protein
VYACSFYSKKNTSKPRKYDTINNRNNFLLKTFFPFIQYSIRNLSKDPILLARFDIPSIYKFGEIIWKICNRLVLFIQVKINVKKYISEM